jgi:hypothetical protein
VRLGTEDQSLRGVGKRLGDHVRGAATVDLLSQLRMLQTRTFTKYTVHMARHYTDGVAAEDRRAAEHVGAPLD